MTTADRLAGHYGSLLSNGDTAPVEDGVGPYNYVLSASVWHGSSLITMQDGSQKLISQLVNGDRVQTCAPVCVTAGQTFDYREAINPNDTTLQQPKAFANRHLLQGNDYLVNTQSYAFNKGGYRPITDVTWVSGEAIVSSVGVAVNIPNTVANPNTNPMLYRVRGTYLGSTLIHATLQPPVSNEYHHAAQFGVEFVGDVVSGEVVASNRMALNIITAGLGTPIRLVKPSTFDLSSGWHSNPANLQAVDNIKTPATTGVGAWLNPLIGKYYGVYLRRGTLGTPSNHSPCFIVNGCVVV